VSLGRRLSDPLALGAAFLAVAYGAYLLVIGPNSPYQTEEGAAGTIQLPTFAGSIPLGIGLLAIWAVVNRRTLGPCAAGGLALVFSVVFLLQGQPPPRLLTRQPFGASMTMRWPWWS
jgi:hypothetical protein